MADFVVTVLRVSGQFEQTVTAATAAEAAAAAIAGELQSRADGPAPGVFGPASNKVVALVADHVEATRQGLGVGY